METALFFETCAGIRLIAKDGGIVSGRALESGVDLKPEIVAVPSGITIIGSTPDGSAPAIHGNPPGALSSAPACDWGHAQFAQLHQSDGGQCSACRSR